MTLIPAEEFAMTADHRALAFVLTLFAAPTAAIAAAPVVFVTAFAPGDKGGIHAYSFDGTSGKLKPLHRTGGVENPFFLALSPDKKFRYGTNRGHDSIACYAVGDDGRLALVAIEPSLGKGRRTSPPRPTASGSCAPTCRGTASWCFGSTGRRGSSSRPASRSSRPAPPASCSSRDAHGRPAGR